MNPIIILTGPIRSGKTTMLQQWTSQHKMVAGILTPVINSERLFFNIQTGDSFSMHTTTNEADVLQVGSFNFSKENFMKASNIISQAAKSPCTYLIIDEIGPLELSQNKGFYDILIYLISNLNETCRLILTVRQNCLEEIQNLVNSKKKTVDIYSVDEFKRKFLSNQSNLSNHHKLYFNQMKKFFLPIILFFCFQTVFGQWNSNSSVNNIIANTIGYDAEPAVVSDGANGSIVFFVDYQNSHLLYAQRITNAGVISWGTTVNPTIICNAAEQRFDLKAISDGAGGAFIAWSDFRFDVNNGEIYIQHVNSSGTSLWTVNGVRITTAASADDFDPLLCSDGAGGVIVSWTKDNLVDNIQMYSQRLNSSGVALWAASGVQLSTAPGFRAGNTIVSDGANGAIVFFLDTRNDPFGLDYEYLDTSEISNADIYAQRVSGSGAILWTPNGAAISTAPGNQVGFDGSVAVSDGSGGAILGFNDGRNDVPLPNGDFTNYDIAVQRVNSSGIPQWTANGLSLTAAAGNQFLNSMIADGAGGIIASWEDEADGIVKSQKVTSGGAISWALNGVPVSATGEYSYFSQMIADGSGNYIYAYDVYNGSSTLKAQKLNSAGVRQWAASGVFICNAPGAYPDEVRLVPSDNGSVIAVWPDERNFSTTTDDLYASKLLSTGLLDGTAAGYTTVAAGNWNNPAIWNAGAVPPSTATVVVRHNVNVTANASCYSLKVELPAGNLTVKTGVVFNVLH